MVLVRPRSAPTTSTSARATSLPASVSTWSQAAMAATLVQRKPPAPAAAVAANSKVAAAPGASAPSVQAPEPAS